MSAKLTPSNPGGWSRRRWLQCTGTLSLLATPFIGACGGGQADLAAVEHPALRSAAPGPSGFAAWVDHRSTQPSSAPLPVMNIGAEAAPDRLGAAATALCLRSPGAELGIAVPEPVWAGDWSLSAWLQVEPASNPRTEQTLCRWLRADGSPALALNCRNGSIWTLQGFSGQATSASTALPSVSGETLNVFDGQWHQLSVRCRSGQLSLAVDGIRWTAPMGPILAGTQAVTALAWSNADLTLTLDAVRIDNAFVADETLALSTYRWEAIRPNVLVDFLAYYPFSGDAQDLSAQTLHGVVHGAEPAPDRHGQSHRAYRFDGAGAHIAVAGPIEPAQTGDWAMAFQARCDAAAPMTAVAVTQGTSPIEIAFNGPSGIAAAMDGRAVLQVGQSGALADGQWHFILLQQKGDLLELWLDGHLAASRAMRVPLGGPGSSLLIGCNGLSSNDAQGFWIGVLDEVQIHARSFDVDNIRRLAGFELPPRDGAGLLSLGGQLWLLGGWNPQLQPSTTNDIWRSHNGIDWQAVGRPPWEGRHTSGWAVFKDRLWVVGGDHNRGHYQTDIWSSPDGSQWDLVCASPPWANRIAPSVAAFNDRLWVFGGTTAGEPAGLGQAFNDVYSSPDGVEWRLERAQAEWAPRGLILGGLAHEGRLWLVGGGRYDDGRTYLNDVWSSRDGVEWTLECSQPPWSGRQYHSVVAHHGKIWVIAGSAADRPGGTNDVWYSHDGRHWTALPATPWPARHAAAVASHQGRLWLTGGSDQSLYNDVWALRFA